MFEKVIFLDKKLLKGYKKKEEKIVKSKKEQIDNLGGILKRESDVLMYLEAKLPPPKKVNLKLLSNKLIYDWISRIFALLSYFEYESEKEKFLFKKLKSNEIIRKKINKKIKHVLREKKDLLRLKEQRALSMDKLRIDNEWRLVFHQFNAASKL